MSAQDTIAAGTRVVFAASFLRNTGQFTGWAPFAQGTVLEVDERLDMPSIVKVQWDGEAEPMRSLVTNLWPLDKRHLEPR